MKLAVVFIYYSKEGFEKRCNWKLSALRGRGEGEVSKRFIATLRRGMKTVRVNITTFIKILYLAGKQPPSQLQPIDGPPSDNSVENITRISSCSSFQILSRSSSSSSSVAGVSSHESDGPLLVPSGTSGVLGAGILAAAFSAVGSVSNAVDRLKAEIIPAST